MRLNQWALDLAAQLASATTPVAVDPRDARVPGGVLMVRTITPDRLAATPVTVEWDLVLLSAGATPVALDELGVMAGDVLSRFPDLTFEAVTITDPNLAGGADPLPALTTTITTDCEDD